MTFLPSGVFERGVRRDNLNLVALIETLKQRLARLRQLFFDRAEAAYADSDAAGKSPEAQSYSEGEAHAYGDAEQEMREAEAEEGQAEDVRRAMSEVRQAASEKRQPPG